MPLQNRSTPPTGNPGSAPAWRDLSPPTVPNSFIYACVSAEKQPCQRSAPLPIGNPGSTTDLSTICNVYETNFAAR